jgi:predicted dehydrogenase
MTIGSGVMRHGSESGRRLPSPAEHATVRAVPAPLRIGLAGVGLIGRAHAERLGRAADGRLAAIADPDPGAAALALGLGVPHHATLEAMLSAEHLDGVILATPNALHVPQALLCLDRGLPVLVEKPLADTQDGGERIVAATARTGVPVLVGQYRRHNPILGRARAAVRDGEIGRVVTVSAVAAFFKPEPYFETSWRREPGGGPVLINLIHTIDDLRFLFGEIAEIKAIRSNAIRGFTVEDSAAAVLRFESGALGSLVLSDTAAAPWSWELTADENPAFPPHPEDCYLIAGTEGALAVPSLRRWRYPGERSWTLPLDRARIEVARADPLDRQIAHFCRVIRGEEPPLVDAADGFRTLAATLAVRDQAL